MKPSSKLYNRVIIEIKDKEISELKKENEKLLKIQKGMIKIEDVEKIFDKWYNTNDVLNPDEFKQSLKELGEK